jgi:hypothetical protein
MSHKHKKNSAADNNKLGLCLETFYLKQYYSMSDWMHISSSLILDQLVNSTPAPEWLDTYKYYLKLSTSQNEEMVQIGALCYSIFFMNQDNLKVAIQNHPLWAPPDLNNPPIFDIHLGDFITANKKTKMLFITAERSNHDILTQFFKDLYDANQKFILIHP